MTTTKGLLEAILKQARTRARLSGEFGYPAPHEKAEFRRRKGRGSGTETEAEHAAARETAEGFRKGAAAGDR
jgi:hypothetical protein